MDIFDKQIKICDINLQVCKANHQTPSKIMMMRGGEPAKTPSPKRALSTTEIMVTKLRSRSHHLAEDLGKICHPGLVKSGVESVKDQVAVISQVCLN